MGVQPSPGGALERSQESSLADVVNTILEKGVVIDVFARVSLVGIELLRADVRVVIASVDTYLRFAERVDRLEMGAEEPRDLTEVAEGLSEGAAEGKSKGVLEAGAEKLGDLLGSGEDAKEPARHNRESKRR
jgi:gas vesicle structural protein